MKFFSILGHVALTLFCDLFSLRCSCPTGYKGKICGELEYCAMFKCPDGATCLNLADGYDCLSNITFNGRNSSLSYQSSLVNASNFYNFSTNFRTQVILYSAV